MPALEPLRNAEGPPAFSPAPELIRAELLHELFEMQADARTHQIALACREERMTYGELEAKANQLARFLRERGAGPGQTVALLLPRSMDIHVGLLAVLKAGAAYVPLDADYPADRIQFILENAGVAAVISVSALAPKLGAFEAHAVLLDTQAREISARLPARLGRTQTRATPRDLCYIIYTSGTTGRPKGVQIEHRSACHLVRAEGRLFEVRPQDRVYQGFSIAFDASVEEIWLAFFAGATLVVGTRDMVFSGPALSQSLADAEVTVLSTVPTQLAMMTEDVPSIRLLILGGEACPPGLVERWARPDRRMVNTYGPTEATVIATCGELSPGRPVTIGRPSRTATSPCSMSISSRCRRGSRVSCASAASVWLVATSGCPS
jgi:amino acid adenylation domain-containing protein